MYKISRQRAIVRGSVSGIAVKIGARLSQRGFRHKCVTTLWTTTSPPRNTFARTRLPNCSQWNHRCEVMVAYRERRPHSKQVSSRILHCCHKIEQRRPAEHDKDISTLQSWMLSDTIPTGRRSLPVQQTQPLFISKISSFVSITSASSIPTSPNSFSMTAIFFPCDPAEFHCVLSCFLSCNGLYGWVRTL
jgi:hypothetical protein